MTRLPRLGAARGRWALLALPVLLLQLLIPAGFMPADDAALSLQICPEGLPAALLAHAGHHHHHGGGGHRGGEHCVFAAGGANGPPSQHTPATASPRTGLVAAASWRAPLLPVRLVHLPEARGPPPVG
ncbi:MAG: hypothetical protein KGJ68_05545 [Gammaproteobacteria bacterium]|nr:hypothetical protein [Gammaproteobacteria bacterium]